MNAPPLERKRVAAVIREAGRRMFFTGREANKE
jgi:hypothetical protein